MKINVLNQAPNFFVELIKQRTHTKEKHEKTINTNRYRQYRRGPGAIGSVSDHWYNRRCRPERGLLTQSGFKVITVTTPQQQQAVAGLTQGRVSAVTYNKKTYYVFPTGTKDKIYVGKQAQFNRYKQALAAHVASHPAAQTAAQQGQAQMAGQSLMPTLETAGPNHIEVQQFGGFGPMGVNALGDW